MNYKNYQIGIPTVNRLINQLITSPCATKSIIHAELSYPLFFNISITISRTNPIHKLAMRNSKEATIATFTMHIAKRGNFYLITSMERWMNFTSLYCCYGSFWFILRGFTLLPS